uniref:transcription factor Adf-1-like n=1 Tax=Styela clava TaxID=7725 RepID=UPI001939C68F|nr:transcription factor Adf-1-like [Styela clava]
MSFEELLINEMKSRPCLYDMSRHDYRDVNIKSNNWAEIGALLHVTGQQAREKWKALRDRFVKMKNKNESTMKSGAPGGVSTNKWHLFEHMTFLDSFVQHRKTSSNLELVTLSAVVEGGEVSGSSSVAPTPKKRKEEEDMRILEILEEEKDDDPDKFFLLSLLPQLKRLSPERASSTKMKIMQLLHEAEFEK